MLGSQPWVTIGCRFSDSTGVTPRPKSYFEGLTGTAEPGFDHFWRQLSYDNVNLAGSQVVAWYNLPQPRSYYLSDPQTHFAGHTLNWQLIADDCTAVADTDVFFPNFKGINLVFNQDLDCCAWGGGATLTRDGQTKSYSMTWMPPWGYNSHYVLAQEMGHGFGLPHSSGPYSQTYDSKWDPMSSGGTCSPPDATYGCLADHTIAYHKDIQGWIPSARRYVPASNSNQTITLERLGLPTTTTGYLMAKIPIGGSSTQFYTVEARRLSGYDGTAPIPGEAVVIHKVDTTLSDRQAQVVDPDNNLDPNDAGAMWLPGETFIDSANNIAVEVTGATATGYTVRVQNGNAAPPNDNFANAQALTGTLATANGTNVGATLESGDPATVDTRTTSHTVWYRWASPVSGAVEVNTCTASFDTLLGVYTGTLGSLTQVGANDDTPGCGGGLQSKVVFNATAFTTYRILVDGYNGLQGTFTLTLKDIAPPRVTSTTPANNATGVLAGANLTAKFSEAMKGTTINVNTFTLRRSGTTTNVSAVVSYDSATKTATLNPSSNLIAGASYTATVTTAARDKAGNQLDQNPSLSGNQKKVWTFQVAP